MQLDPYIVRTLMRDLIGHDRVPSAYLLYVWLWGNTRGLGRRELGRSLQDMASDTGLSKSSVQNAVRHLSRRRLLAVRRDGHTSPCFYRVLAPWLGEKESLATTS